MAEAQLFPFINTIVSSLDYLLVDLELTPQNTLRVFIDHPNGITIKDCEKLSHQLSRALLVEDIDYQTLEVSSPGLDRKICSLEDFNRFAGSAAQIKLHTPVEPYPQRKRYQGVLQAPKTHPSGDMIGLMIKEKNMPILIEFLLSNIDNARLVPQIDFRGNR